MEIFFFIFATLFAVALSTNEQTKILKEDLKNENE